MEYFEFTGQIALAAFLGGIIGWQRRRTGKSAGFRTFSLVSVGSAFYTIIAISGFQAEAARIVAQILTGVGFIGAGIIFHKNDNIDGLTTAAGLWTVAAVGVAVGLGFFIEATIVTALVFIILALMLRSRA